MSTDKETISKLYKQGEKSGPTAALDDAILSAARNAVQNNAQQTSQSATTGSPFSGGWRASFSIAAVLVISVILIPLLQQEEKTQEVTAQKKVAPVTSSIKNDSSILIKEYEEDSVLIMEETAEIKTVAKKRLKAEALKQKHTQPSQAQTSVQQVHKAPVKTLNKSSLSRMQSPAVQEKIQAMSEMVESDQAITQAPQSASTAPTGMRPKKQRLSAFSGIKQQRQKMVAADSMPSASSSVSTAIMPAEPWLQKIRQLITQGNLEQAKKELDEFKLNYPDEKIDSSIVDQLKDVFID